MREKISSAFRDYFHEIALAIKMLSPKEKLVFSLLTFIFVMSTFIIAWKVNNLFLVEVPAEGGELTEGVIGTPRFINPLLATGDADRDLTMLIYSGLMRAGENGEILPDLAEKYQLSEDGLTYIFTLKDDLVWQDGQKLTSDDVVFTIKTAQDPNLKSPRRASWEGVAVEKIDERTVKFFLKSSYASFLENATLGILPKHIWKNISSDSFALSDRNLKPIGSGPYKVNRVERGPSGIAEYYELVPFKKFALGAPKISKLFIYFFPSEESLLKSYRQGKVESMNAISTESALELKEKGNRVEKSSLPLPRVFAVFFNQNHNELFSDQNVRKALDMSLDRDILINRALKGYAMALDGPIPPSSLGYVKMTGNETASSTRAEEARTLLAKTGWKWNASKKVLEKNIPSAGQKRGSSPKDKSVTKQLAFSLVTSDTPELAKAAEAIKQAWENIGAKVELKTLEIGDLNQNIIRPRKYDALFFGEIIGRDPDPFSFWHSSQRNDPGLNVALYANIKVDKILESARAILDKTERASKYSEFAKELTKDVPAVFVYSPYFLYVVPEKIQGLRLESVTIPSERFLHINSWYIERDKVWKIFTNDN